MTTIRWKVDEKHIDHVLNFALANPNDIEDATGMTEQEIEHAVATLRREHNAHEALVEALQRASKALKDAASELFETNCSCPNIEVMNKGHKGCVGKGIAEKYDKQAQAALRLAKGVKQTKSAIAEQIEYVKANPERFVKSFLNTVENAESVCVQCSRPIYVDVLIGGGCPDWSTEDGDFGCTESPDTDEHGTGSHIPRKRN